MGLTAYWSAHECRSRMNSSVLCGCERAPCFGVDLFVTKTRANSLPNSCHAHSQTSTLLHRHLQRCPGPCIQCMPNGHSAGGQQEAHPPPPRVTCRPVFVSLRGPGQSPVLPFACCVGLLRSVGRCGRCSCWCRFRVRGAQSLVCRGCAECGGMCRLRVSGAQYLAYWGLCWLLRGSFDCFCCPHTSVLRPSIACLAA